jgi:hypothetical protein
MVEDSELIPQWTVEEEATFCEAIRKHGKDWLKLSDECNRTVSGIKSKTFRIKKSYKQH